MLFNINKTELNNPNLFTFVEAGEKDAQGNDTIDEIQTSYNEFVKQNTSTMANSTLLRDGSYGYTIQHIVRFDLNPVELRQTEVRKEVTKINEEETITMTDLSQDKDIQNLLSQINVEREESKKITSDKILTWANQGKTKEQIIATLNMALKAKLNTDQKNCD
jgi:hypothetical protein